MLQEAASTPQKVELKRVGFRSTGMYRCEVTVSMRRPRDRDSQQQGYGYKPIVGFDVQESYNRMTVVGKSTLKCKAVGSAS